MWEKEIILTFNDDFELHMHIYSGHHYEYNPWIINRNDEGWTQDEIVGLFIRDPITKEAIRRKDPRILEMFRYMLDNIDEIVDEIKLHRNYKEPPEIKKINSQPIPEHGYIYVIQAPAMDPALYKIGREKILRNRLDTLNIKLPWKLEIIAHIETDDYKGLENKLHQRFADKRDKGEWFRLTEEDIAYVRSLGSG